MHNLLLIYLLTFLATTQEGGMNVLVPLTVAAGGASTAMVGIVYGLAAAFRLISRPPVGAFYTVDRGMWMAGAGLLVVAASNFGFTLASGSVAFAVLYAVHGFGFGVVTTVMLALCMDARPEGTKVGEVMGWYTAAIAAGYMTGGFLGGWAGEAFGLPVAYRLLGLLPAVSLLPLLMFRTGDLARPEPGAAAAAAARKAGKRRLALRGLTLPVLVAALIAFYMNFFNDVMDALFPVYAQAAGYSTGFIGYMKGFKSMGSMAIRLVSGPLLRYLDHRKVNLVSLVVLAAAVAAVPLTLLPVVLLGLFVLQGICRGIARVTSATLVAEGKGSAADSGAASGWYNAGLDLGATLGPASAGLLAGFMGLKTTLVVLPAVFLAIYAVLEVALRRYEARKLAGASAQAG